MSGSEEKTLAPTARKLRDARRKGEFGRSKDLVVAVVTTINVGVIVLWAGVWAEELEKVIELLPDLEQWPFATAASFLTRQLGWVAAGLLGPMLLLLVVAACAAGLIGNGGLSVSFTPLSPKFDRLDPVKGFGRIFKLRNLIELGKSVAKLVMVFGLAFVFLRSWPRPLQLLPSCGLACLPETVRATFVPLCFACCSAVLALSLLDVGLQKWLFERDMRMTRTEHKRDRKDSESNPELAARRRKERQETARLDSLAGLRHATFVIEARHLALAFRYAPPTTAVPMLVAAGRRSGSRRLVTDARRRELPIVFDPESAAILASHVTVGRLVPKAAFIPIIRCMKVAGVI